MIKSPLIALILIMVVAFSVAGYYFLTVTVQHASSSTATSTGTRIFLAGTYKWGDFSCAGAHGSPCPVGFRKVGNTINNYTTFLSGTGLFNFTIAPNADMGTGLGQGSVTATTRGYCNGTSTVAYTFSVTAFFSAATRNVTLRFGTPMPINSTVQLSCADANGQSYESSGVYQLVSVLPDLISIPAVPGTVVKGTSASAAYEIVLH